MPFLIYSGMPNAPVWINSEPGLHRIVDWNPGPSTWIDKKDKNKVHGCVSVTFIQRQWSHLSEMSLVMPHLTMELTLGNEHCKPLLLTKDMDAWDAVMQANPIPFYALVCVDSEKSSGKPIITLSALAVHWDLRAYLERSCLELSAKTVKSFLPGVTGGDGLSKDKVHNISALGKMPIGPGWRYYALTANGATHPDELESPAIIFTAWTEVRSSEPSKKKTKREQ